MKKIALLLLSVTLIVISCKKEIEPNPSDILPSSFTKRVLLEDYTKHCQFCIPVNSMVDSIKNSHSNRRLIPILISVNHPTQISYFDSISTIFQMSFFPRGSVDRTPAVNSGMETGKLVYTKEKWASNIDLELMKETNYGLKINTTLSGNSLNITVKIGSMTATTQKKLSVFIIEDNLYYRTVRKVLTYYKGDNLDLSTNGITKKEFNNIDLNGLNIAKTSVVAFVHSFDEPMQNFEIDNVNEAEVGNSVSW